MSLAYVDTSVILRHVLGEPQAYKPLKQLETVWANELLRVEALRAIDRVRLHAQLSSEEIALRISTLLGLLANIREVPIQPPILRQAAQPLPTVIGTLDAIHLATAILVREQIQNDLLFLTHDRRQGIAAQAAGFEVRGCFG